MGFFDFPKKAVKKARKKKASFDIGREARKGVKRTKQLRKWKGEELMFSAKADREEQRARLRGAKQGGRKKRKVSGRTKRKLGMSLF